MAVEDAGPGVPLPDREHVFRRLALGAVAPDRGHGQGLGLALAREHVRLLGGNLTIEDRDGSGARFVIRLPLATSASNHLTPLRESLSSAGRTSGW